MEFHDKKEIPPKYIYLFLTGVCLLLLFLSVIFEGKSFIFKQITSAIVTPMQKGVNTVGASIFDRVVDQKEKKALIEENEALKEQLAEYSSKLETYELETYELGRLQELLDLQEQYPEYETIGARVIATDSTNWFYTFVIDKGEADGVQVGCNILADGGLVGIVTEVGADYAKIRAIIDDNSSVSAAVAGTDTLCTVSGDLTTIKDGYINVGYINKADEIKEGSELVTSHVSDKFLPGLLIGYIAEVEMDANNLTKSAKCLPVVDFNNLQEVLVIMTLKSEYKTNSTSKNIYDNVTNTEDSRPASSEETSENSSENTSSEEPTSEQGTTSEEQTGEEGSQTGEEDSQTGEDEPQEGDEPEAGGTTPEGDEGDDGTTPNGEDPVN